MPELATPPSVAPGQPEPRQTASNIANAIQDKGNGKAPAASQPPIKGQEQPPVNPSAEKPVDPNAGKEKYVVEGKEVWLTPDQVRAYVQKGIAFEPRMDQLARLANEQTQLMRGLITNPGAVLANIAKQHNVPMQDLVKKVLSSNVSDEIKEAVGEWYYNEAVEPLKLTEAEKKARADAKYREERERKDKMEAEAAVHRENLQRFQNAMAQIKAGIGEAMKESELADNNSPLGAKMAKLVADEMRVAYFKREQITPKQAIDKVKRELKEVNKTYGESKIPTDVNDPKYIEKVQPLIEFLGDRIVGAVQLYLLKKHQSAGNPPPIVPSTPEKSRVTVRNVNNGRTGTITPDEMHEYLERRKREG